VEIVDSLYSIAKNYNTSVNELISLNNLKSTNLSIGQKLLVPESFNSSISLPTYVNYTVKRGDNLYSIANTYNTTVDTIKKDNSLSTNLLTIGQVLKIRTTSDSFEIEDECYGEDYVQVINTPPSTQNYTVKRGDSLYKIASLYNTSVNTIMSLNNFYVN